MHITLRQLEIFIAVAQHGRVTSAAESLFISQPAASMALSELEKHLGALFDRSQSAGLRLNDSGRALIPKACELVDRAKELEAKFQPDALCDEGMIVLNASSTIGNNLLPKMLAQFNQKFPNVRVELAIDNTRVIEKRILAFEIDLALVEGTCLNPDIDTQRWLEDELIVVANREHPFVEQDGITISDLSSQTWVLRESGSGTRELFEEVIAPQLHQVNISMTLNRSEALRQAVFDGVGIACMSKIAAHTDLESGRMRQIEVKGLNLKRHFYILIHKKKYLSTTLQEMLTFFEQRRG